MSTSRIPSVNDTYFQHKVLTRILGQPTYKTLQNLSTEIKANAASVPSTLGGGHYGHLGLILSPDRYATLAHTVPWVSPDNPGPFIPPAAGTGPQIEAAKDVWRELKLSFDLCQATEKALIAQVVASIDQIYLRALLNRTTGQYPSDLCAVLLHLFTTHGKITPQQVKAKEMSTYNMHYDISQPVDTVFNTIDDLTDLAEHAHSPMTPQQMMDMAYAIFARQPILLQQDLRLWNRRPVVERTWPNMLAHFRDAQSDLNSLPSAGDVFHQQPHHQANTVSTMADLVAQCFLDAMPVDDSPRVVASSDTANAAFQQCDSSLAAREAALLTQMTEMMSLMRTGLLNGSASHQRTPRNSRSGRTGRNNNGRTGSRGRGNSPAPRAYCWSHGACAHSGTQCNYPLPGHLPNATFADMQGGNTSNCFWLPLS
jgi:hypothetical protein